MNLLFRQSIMYNDLDEKVGYDDQPQEKTDTEVQSMGNTIKEFELNNYGPLPSFHTDRISNINLVIGENGTGKTFFLKALYSAVKTAEEYKRGDDIRSFSDVLSEKLRWTFQIEKLGDMVSRSEKEILSFDLSLGEERISYRFSESAQNKVVSVTAPSTGRASNSIFIPAKEVLSLYSVILKSREVDHSFGFDDTYYDLVKALICDQKAGSDRNEKSRIRVIYLTKKDGITEISDLHDGMPDNSIIDAAIHLYDMEIEEGL